MKSLGFSTTNERFYATRMSEGSNIKLVFTTKLKVDVICDMHFGLFPFDSQTCKFFIQSLKGQKRIRLYIIYIKRVLVRLFL